ncbi:MAG TPA: hypothetical protein VNQ77_00150 [Frankiaceae bacterium]|nr:hypothetical protein [Frankiaceae bacterium]
MKRTLNLKRETLAELTPADLFAVVGAAAARTNDGFTCPVVRCDVELSALLGCLLTRTECETNNC